VLIKIIKISALTVHGIPTLLGNNGGVAPIVKNSQMNPEIMTK
jgi:hypothetical protein